MNKSSIQYLVSFILQKMKLKVIFFELIQKYTSDQRLIEPLWVEIEKKYSKKKRHYHNLTHLENLYFQLSKIKAEINDWDTLLFSLFYHDVIYNASKRDNEEKSADLAKENLLLISYPIDKINICYEQIMATKSHAVSDNNDTNFFTDADLSILGQSWKEYEMYSQHVRKEYAVYPDFLYNPGRKKVLHHFLSMKRIFKMDYFFEKFEKQARENLSRELKEL